MILLKYTLVPCACHVKALGERFLGDWMYLSIFLSVQAGQNSQEGYYSQIYLPSHFY